MTKPGRQAWSQARLGSDRHGSARLGTARHGSARHGSARHGLVARPDRQAWSQAWSPGLVARPGRQAWSPGLVARPGRRPGRQAWSPGLVGSARCEQFWLKVRINNVQGMQNTVVFYLKQNRYRIHFGSRYTSAIASLQAFIFTYTFFDTSFK